MNKVYLHKFFRPSVIFLVLINAVCLTCGKWLDAKGFNHEVLMVANLILCVLTLITCSIHVKAMNNPNPHAFVRGVTAASFIKLIVIAISVLIYLVAAQTKSIYAILLAMLFYIVYTIIEVKGAMSINSKRNA